MRIIDRPLVDYRETGREIWSMIDNFSGDIGNLKNMDLDEYYKMVKNIPYLMDGDYWRLSGKTPEEDEIWELVARPRNIFGYLLDLGIDCKKKTILIGSWLKENDLIQRIVAVSELPNKQLHHVFNQVHLNGDWVNIDATYSDMKLFEFKPQVTGYEVLFAN